MRSFIFGCSAVALFAGSALAQSAGVSYSPTFMADTAPIQTMGMDATAHRASKVVAPAAPGALGLASITDRYLSATLGMAYASFYDGAGVDSFHEYENHMFGSAAIGGYINQATSGIAKTRVEAEVTYREAEVDGMFSGFPMDAKNEQLGLYGNGYLDFFSPYAFAPYVGAGLGVVNNDVSGSLGTDTLDGEGMAFGYQAMAGITAPIAQMAVAKLGYRYQGFEGADIKVGTNNESFDLDAGHSVDLGFMVKF